MFQGKAREVRLRRFVLKTDREDVKRMLRMELPGRRFRGRPEDLGTWSRTRRKRRGCRGQRDGDRDGVEEKVT